MTRFLAIIVVLLSAVALAQLESPLLPDSGPKLQPAQEARARSIGSTLRCPVCRGLPIAESPAELARQMMGELRTQIAAGKNDDQIVDYFIARYGNTVLLSPPKSGVGLIVWLAPVLAVLLGGWGLWTFLRGSSRREIPEADPALLARVRAELAGGPAPAPAAPIATEPRKPAKGAKK